MTHFVPAFFFVLFPLVPAFTDTVSVQFAADAGRALDRIGLSREAAAIELDVPLNKLCDQLNGKARFTLLWLMFVGLDQDFREEFLFIVGARVGVAVIRNTDLQRLVRGIEAIAGKRRMVKARLTPAREERVG